MCQILSFLGVCSGCSPTWSVLLVPFRVSHPRCSRVNSLPLQCLSRFLYERWVYIPPKSFVPKMPRGRNHDFSFIMTSQEALAQCFSHMMFVELSFLQMINALLNSENPGSCQRTQNAPGLYFSREAQMHVWKNKAQQQQENPLKM